MYREMRNLYANQGGLGNGSKPMPGDKAPLPTQNMGSVGQVGNPTLRGPQYPNMTFAQRLKRNLNY